MTDYFKAPDEYETSRKDKLPVWQRNRDFCAGIDAVKAKGETYLPKDVSMTDDDYEAHKKVTELFPAARRTLQSHVSLVFRKPPVEKVPAVMAKQNATSDGWSRARLAKWALAEYAVTNDGGILTDFAINDQKVKRAQAEKAGLQPYSTPVPAENILEVKYGDVGGLRKLVLVRILRDKNTVTFLELIGGIYTVTSVGRTEGGTWALIGNAIQPKIKELFIDEIPFKHLADDDATALYDDLCSDNETHYAKNGRLEMTLAWAGKPQPWVAGVPEEAAKLLSLAHGSLWRFDDKETKCGYLTFNGGNITEVKGQLSKLEDHMVSLGSRLLVAEKTDAASESEISVARRSAAEGSILAAAARHISVIIEQSEKWRARWQGANQDEVTFSLNTDFVSTTIDSQLLAQLVSLNQNDKLPDPLFFECLKRGEIVDDSVTFEKYQDLRDQFPADAPAVSLINDIPLEDQSQTDPQP